MNMVMQEVLIKVIRSAQHFVDIPNHKFDEMLIFLDGIFDHLRAQAPTSSAYDSLSKQINIIFQRLFERLVELKLDSMLALEARPFHVRGGEMKTIQWKSISEFALWDEDSDKEIVEIETCEVEDDDDEEDEDDLVNGVIMGPQAIKE